MCGKKFKIFKQYFVIRLIFFFAFSIPFLSSDLVGIVLADENSYELGTLRISSLYIRGTIQSRPAAGYMTIHNLGSEPDKLISISSPMAERVELHKTSIENGIAKMFKMPQIPLPPKSTIILKPGSFHLMVMGLKKPLVIGTLFPMTLSFATEGAINTQFKVKGFSEKKRKHGKH